MSTPLCAVFRTAAQLAWDLIEAGQTARVRAAEETLTNLLLIRATLERAPGFRIRAFTRQEERLSGADWEMWLGNRGGPWLGIRVQAKAVDLAGLEYPHLHFRGKNAALFQSDALISAALTGY